MRTVVLNVVAPPTSPEESPAMSYAVVFFSSLACLSVAWGRFVSDRTLRREPDLGCAASGPRWCMREWASRGAGSVRAGPVAKLIFLFLVLFILFFVELCA